MNRQKAASVRERAFICPHCGAYCAQRWFAGTARAIGSESVPSLFPTAEIVAEIQALVPLAKTEADRAVAEKHLAEAQKLIAGFPRLSSKADSNFGPNVIGLFISSCYVCQDLSFWLRERLIYPNQTSTEPAHPDMPANVRADFEEAAQVLALSPRSAAALLRLALQKLCVHLGKPGKDINQDIAALVADGLDARIQKALDALRVIGNEAVHPGTMDISDDSATATDLFKLLNYIVERMISLPRQMDAIYDGLPPAKLQGIAQRDAKALAKATAPVSAEKIEPQGL